MLHLAAWILLGLVAPADGPTPDDLVRRLGSDRFADRVEAARALERLGTAAIPALRAAERSESARVRARAPRLIEAIERGAERARFERATELTLDFRDRPLSEVIEALNDRHHLGLALQFGPGPMPGMRVRMMGGMPGGQVDPRQAEAAARKVTIVADRPVPFWEAIDRICAAGQLRHDLHPNSVFAPTAGRFALYSGIPGGRSIASDWGPIRTKLLGLHARLERDLGAEKGDGRGQLSIRMAVIPEPGLVVRPAGTPPIAEAVDDRGRKLGAAPIAPQNVYQIPSLAGLSGFDVVATLAIEDLGARSIPRLRGTIPTVMVARTPAELAFPLDAKAAGQAGRIDGASVRIAGVSLDAEDHVSAVEVEVTGDRPQATGYRPWDPSKPPDLAAFRLDQVFERMELLDARGRPVPMNWNQTHGPNFNARRFRLMPLNYAQLMPHGPPVLLKFHGMAQQKADLAFDFRDVPMP